MQRNNTPLSDLITARISLECDIASIVARKAGTELLVEATDNVVFRIMLASVANLLKASRLATLKYTGVNT